MRKPLVMALALMLAWTSMALGRPWQVEDLFHLDDIGSAEFDPADGYLLVERLRPRAEMGVFDMEGAGEIARDLPLVFDLRSGKAPRPLLDADPGAGYALGAISPDGRKVIVYRLQGHAYTLGVIEVATGQADWLDVTPELGRWGRTVQWLSATRLAAIVRPDRSLPLDFRVAFEAPQVASALSQRQADGKASSGVVVGSGRYRDLRPLGAQDDLVVFDLPSGQRRVVASGRFFDLAASADRRYLAVLGDGADIQYPPSQHLKVNTPAFRRSLTLVDIQSGAVTQPAAGYDVLAGLLGWAPDDDRLLVYGRHGDDSWTSGRLLIVDAQRDRVEPTSGVSPLLVDDPAWPPAVQADWLADDPIVFGHATADPEGRADWLRVGEKGVQNLTGKLPVTPKLLAIGTEGMILRSADRYWRIDGAARVTQLGSCSDTEVVKAQAPDEGFRYAFNEAPRRNWIDVRGHRAGRDADTIERLGETRSQSLELDPAARALAVDGSGERVAAMSRDDHGVLTFALAEGPARTAPLLRLNVGLAELEPAIVKPIPHLSGAGTSITSWLYLPPHLPPAARPPLLVWAYPGQTFASPPAAAHPGLSSAPLAIGNVQVLAAHGYAVLVASLPSRPDLSDPADGFAPDILRAVDAAGRTGLIDTGRVALWGHSYGGYAALEVSVRTTRIQAFIASSPVSDFVTAASVFPAVVRFRPADGLWIDTQAGWLEEGQGQVHIQAWVDPERYVRRSPVFSAGEIKAPVLLVGGDNDRSSVPEQREELFSELYRQDKPAILASYVGEGHMIYSPANVRDLYSRVFSFLDENLPRAAPPVSQ